MKKRLLLYLCFFSAIVAYAQTSISYVALMSQRINGRAQAYKISWEIPTLAIEEQKKNGFFITDVSFGADEWCFVFTDSVYTDQIYKTYDVFPEEEIKVLEKKGFFVTRMAYGDHQWFIVYSKSEHITGQLILSDTKFPSAEAEIRQMEGYYITDVAYGYKVCKVLMSKDDRIKAQTFRTSSDILVDFLDAEIAANHHISHLSYQDNIWVAVVSSIKEEAGVVQHYTLSNVPPQVQTMEAWKKGFVLEELQPVIIGSEKIKEPPKPEPVVVTPPEKKEPEDPRKCQKPVESQFMNETYDEAITKYKRPSDQISYILNSLEGECLTVKQLKFLAEDFETEEYRWRIIEKLSEHLFDPKMYLALRPLVIKDEKICKEFDKHFAKKK